MAISFVGSDQNDDTPALTPLTVTYPTIAAGDLAVVVTLSSGDGVHSLDDAGYDELFNHTGTDAVDRVTYVHTKTLDGDETDVTFTCTTSTQRSVTLHVFRNDVAATAWAGDYDAAQGSNNINPASPAHTTSDDNALLLAVLCLTHDDVTVAGAPSGFTLSDSIVGVDKDWRQQIVAYQLDAGTAGVESPGVWTNTGSPTNVADWSTFTISFLPDTTPVVESGWVAATTELFDGASWLPATAEIYDGASWAPVAVELTGDP